jgi:Cu(I)/Ag(I) efflux system membrane fusion protein
MKRNWKKGKWSVLTRPESSRWISSAWITIPLYLIMQLLFISSCQPKEENHLEHNKSPEVWQCPMKCEGDKTYPLPGNCPVCNMSLEKVESHPENSHSEMVQDDPAVNSAEIYTCPMHPQIQKTEPGNCPICGMTLVRKLNNSSSGMTGLDSLGMLLKPTYEYAISSVTTIRPDKKNLNIVIQSPGYLTYDLRKTNAMSARFSGRIEKLYVRFAYQPVRKGQHIMDIYSPEMVTAQQDFIFLLEKDKTNTGLIANARNKLTLLGLTLTQIEMVEKSGQPFLSLPVYSSYSGLVIEKEATLSSARNQDDAGMSTPNNSNMNPANRIENSEGLSLREGMYIQKGQRLFNIQSLETIWAILELYPADIQVIREGQSVSIRLDNQKKSIPGKINYIEPLFGAEGKNLRARVYLNNPGQMLKPGTLLNATVYAGNQTGIWIPETAIIDLGRHKVVFIKSNGFFQSRSIEVGIRSGKLIEVRSGLTEIDELAENAQFLMDSESFVKSN